MTDVLVQFLRERYDEEAELAAPGESWSMFPEGDFGTPRVDVDHSLERVVACTRAWRAKHIARHDPARILAEVDAKRRLLALHEPTTQPSADSDIENLDDNSTWLTCCSTCQTTVVHPGDWPCETLRLLALPYADHPGYRPEWRP